MATLLKYSCKRFIKSKYPRCSTIQMEMSIIYLFMQRTRYHLNVDTLMHLSMLSRWEGRPGKGGGFDCNHRPVVGFCDRFNDLSSNILLTFGCYFDNPQCPGVGHLNGNFQLSSNAPPMPGLPPQRLNIDRCIILRQS